ncbi:MAG: DUF4190 domain-containing protein [Candidatus Saccharibacteria bacterium]
MEKGTSNTQPVETKNPEPVSNPTPSPTVINTQKTNGVAVAAMIVGIIAFVVAWAPFIGFVTGIVAIILGIIGLKKTTEKGMSIVGIVTGAMSALSSLVITLMFIAGIALIGGVASEIDNAADSYNTEQQAKIEAKKDFKKDETAVFGNFEIKVNSIQRNYTPEDQYMAAGEGKELVVVNVSIKNISKKSELFSAYDLGLNVNGVSNFSTYQVVVPEFTGGDISAGATSIGNIVYEITKDATGLKLQHTENVYNSKKAKSETLTYTLVI